MVVLHVVKDYYLRRGFVFAQNFGLVRLRVSPGTRVSTNRLWQIYFGVSDTVIQTPPDGRP